AAEHWDAALWRARRLAARQSDTRLAPGRLLGQSLCRGWGLRACESGDLQRERVVERHLAQLVEAAGSAAVAGVHVDLEQHEIVAELAVTQAGDPLGR